MTERRLGRRGGASELAIARPAAEPRPSFGGYVDLTVLGRLVDGLAWMPLQLAAGRSRPISPRLPHAIVLHLAREVREVREARSTDVGSGGGTAGDATDATVAADPARLGALTAAPAEVVAAVLDALRRADVLQGADTSAVSLAARLSGPPPIAGVLDWRHVADATIGSPSAWVLAHHLAGLMGDSWTPVSRKELEMALDYGTSGLRAALDRLVAGDVIARREQRGGVSVYRFSDAMLRRREGYPPAAGPAVPADPATGRSVARGSVAVESPLIADQGVWLQIGGVDLDVPAGMRLVVTRAPDGRPRIAIAPE